MRGRGAEFETVLGLLDGTQQGQGRVLLVGGEPGTGKSLLLARAGEEAGRRGFRVLAAAADELSPAPSLDGLDGLVSAGPVLVTVDNVQWADLATTQALRSMPRLLGSYPLSWILAVGTSSDAGPAELLFGLLESDGAARISLGPLDHEAQVALIGDVLGAVPDQTLIELAADAAGNPLVLAEAFGGLRDENAIVVRDGHARLARAQVSSAQVSSAQVTSRIETLARDRLKGLSGRARRFVATASILGGSFRLEDVGEMLGESPGALLAALDEALSAYLLVVRADGLAFGMSSSGRRSRGCWPSPSSRPCTGSTGGCCWPGVVRRFPRRTICCGGPVPVTLRRWPGSTMRSRWPNRPRGGWGPAGASPATHSRCRSSPPSPCAVATCPRPPNTCSGCRLSATTAPLPI